MLSRTKKSTSEGDKYQFGFKTGHPTSLCSLLLLSKKNYTDRGSHVFACFVDLTKAFNFVNYWKLFSQFVVNFLVMVLMCILLSYYS